MTLFHFSDGIDSDSATRACPKGVHAQEVPLGGQSYSRRPWPRERQALFPFLRPFIGESSSLAALDSGGGIKRRGETQFVSVEINNMEVSLAPPGIRRNTFG